MDGRAENCRNKGIWSLNYQAIILRFFLTFIALILAHVFTLKYVYKQLGRKRKILYIVHESNLNVASRRDHLH